MSHLVRRQSDSPSFSSVVFLSDDRDREGHLPPLCSLWDESALPAALHLAQLSCSKPTVCALHHSAWRNATILAAASRGEQRRRGSEWKRDGIERERGRGGRRRTKRMDDGCSVAPALPSVHRKLQVPSQGRGKDGGCRGTSQGSQDERWRRDGEEREKKVLWL